MHLPPYTFLPSLLYGTISCLYTVRFPFSLSVRCHFPFSHRTLSFQPFCTVSFPVFTPYTFLSAFLYGVISCFHTVRFPFSLSVRCHFPFSHRTLSFQSFCTVSFPVFTPYTFLSAFLYGVISCFHTVRFPFSLSVRCHFLFLHRTLLTQAIYTVQVSIFLFTHSI